MILTRLAGIVRRHWELLYQLARRFVEEVIHENSARVQVEILQEQNTITNERNEGCKLTREIVRQRKQLLNMQIRYHVQRCK